MKVQSPAYPHRNRHGTFAFRWRPPCDVAQHFVQREYSMSLATKDCRRACRSARRIIPYVEFWADLVRTVKPKKPAAIDWELIRRLKTSGGQLHEIEYDPTNPDDVAEANRVFEALMAGGTASPEQVALVAAGNKRVGVAERGAAIDAA
jgi:hypothetical protein